MYVVFGAYLAYSIADRTGLVVGFFWRSSFNSVGGRFFSERLLQASPVVI